MRSLSTKVLLLFILLLAHLPAQAQGLQSNDIMDLRAQAQASPDMTLHVNRGIGYPNGVLTIFAGGNSPAAVAPASNPYYALLTMDTTPTLAWTYGAEDASPVRPACPIGKLPLCCVRLTPASTSIVGYNDGVSTHGYISDDVRPLWLTNATHSLLSVSHTDTLADSVARGDLLIGNSTPKWARLPFPASPTGKVIQATATDVTWSANPLTIGASASVSGTNTGDQIVPANEPGAASNFLMAYNSATGAWTKGRPTWANIDKTTSSIADITTRSHTSLSDIGTNTHVQIDTALTRLANTSGTNTGDQTISLTGDVTGSGTGNFAATIQPGVVTLAKMANMATASLIYRKTAGAGAPEVNSLATLKTDLGLTGTNSGDQTITLTGDATGSGTGSFATTVSGHTLTEAPGSDHTATGTTVSMTAGEALAFGDVVYFKSDGKVWKADAHAAGLYPAMGLALATINANATGSILLYGIARDDSWNWTVGGVIYLSTTAGALTQTQPASTDNVIQTIGIATNAHRMLFKPSTDYITHT